MQKLPDQIIENADILWQETGAPYSSRFEDIYFSRQGGLAETEHVFIDANRLRERWGALDRLNETEPETFLHTFTVAELGFGTGLNFLCCWRAWQTLGPKTLRLHYIACEKFPLQLDILQRALSQWPELANFSFSLLVSYPDHSPGYHRLQLDSSDGESSVTLDLYYGDAAQLLAAQPRRGGVKVDAWFLDGFAPRVNPDLWSPELMATLARLSHRGTTLSTYSVAGHVVRTLRASGFDVRKVEGFGQKRHMLVGEFQGNELTDTPSANQSWLQLPSQSTQGNHVVVIGAGLAGCSVASSLAKRGYRVTVLEQKGEAATGASGNRQAVLQCRLNNAVNAGWQFNLQAFLYSARHFSAMQIENSEIQWHQCGVLNLDTAFSSRQKHCTEVKMDLYSPAVVRRVHQQEASALCGIEIDGGGNYLNSGGWLNPAALCRVYLRHPSISLVPNTAVAKLQREDNVWNIFCATQTEPVAVAHHVVIANSYAADMLAQTERLPLVPLRGQVSYCAQSDVSQTLSSVVCGLSYISPAADGLHSAGASYSKDISDLSLSAKEHSDNVEGIGKHFPEGAISATTAVSGRVSIRAGTGDRMPMVGPVVNFDLLTVTYANMGQRERQAPTSSVPYYPGLYVSVGHGSHGLSNCPLSAEYIASLINNEASPLQTGVTECVHPARFFLRELRKQNFVR